VNRNHVGSVLPCRYAAYSLDDPPQLSFCWDSRTDCKPRPNNCLFRGEKGFRWNGKLIVRFGRFTERGYILAIYPYEETPMGPTHIKYGGGKMFARWEEKEEWVELFKRESASREIIFGMLFMPGGWGSCRSCLSTLPRDWQCGGKYFEIGTRSPARSGSSSTCRSISSRGIPYIASGYDTNSSESSACGRSSPRGGGRRVSKLLRDSSGG